MILDGVILKTIRSDLVTAHTATDLLSPCFTDRAIILCLCIIVKSALHFCKSFIVAILAASGLRSYDGSSWLVYQATAILVLVSVLTAGTGATEPFYAKIQLI